MTDYTTMTLHTTEPEYDKHFWNGIRGDMHCWEKLRMGRNTLTGAYALPAASQKKFRTELEKESLFRKIGTTLHAYRNGSRIFATDGEELSQWVPEGGDIPVYDGIEDFTRYPVESHKLAAMFRMEEDFIRDASFDVESYLIKRLAKNFGKAEEDAFINGTGTSMPTGILAEKKGADTVTITGDLKFDAIHQLYFSVKPEYRLKGYWLMSDETALYLRNLKDDSGNYLWRGAMDTLLGRPVIISQFMPSAEVGKKPIAFGDFSYYWIIPRDTVRIRALKEKFAAFNQIGYLAYEFLDGKLIRPEAVKAIQIAAENEE